MKTLRHTAVAFALALLPLAPSVAIADAPPPADDPALRGSARKLGEDGNRLFDEGKWEEALKKYEQAASIIQVPTLPLKSARCLVKLGRLVEAAERYLVASRMPVAADAVQVVKDAPGQAEAERALLLPRIPSLVIKLTGAKADVSVDGKAVPAALIGEKWLVDPGKHQVEAKRGAKVENREVTVTEGQSVPVTIDIQAPPGEDPNAVPGEKGGPGALTWVGLTGIIAGAVGLGIGIGTGVAAVDKKAQLEIDCGTQLQCLPPFHDAADNYNTLRVATTAALVVGGVLATAGIVLVAVDPKKKAAPATALQIGPGSLSFRMKF